jgi:hypothetical protein
MRIGACQVGEVPLGGPVDEARVRHLVSDRVCPLPKRLCFFEEPRGPQKAADVKRARAGQGLPIDV